MKESWKPPEIPETGSATLPKPAQSADFSRFQKSNEAVRRNLATEEAERMAELSSVDPSGELFSNTPVLLATNDTQKADVPHGYRFEAKQEYAKEAQDILYANLGIDPATENNGWEKKFLKGLVDASVISNAEFVETVLKEPGKALEALRNLDVTAILKWLGETVSNVFSWDWYLFGKGLGESWVVISWAWAVFVWGRKLAKKGMEAIARAAESPSPVTGSLRAQRGAVGEVPKPLERKLSFDITKNETYQRHPYLKDHAEFFGELRPSDIMGVGNNAIVVRHPKIEGQVVKIPYPGEVDSVTKEILSHQKAYLALHKGIHEGKLNGEVRIPEVYANIPDMKNLFVMQRVEGQSLHTRMVLEMPEYRNVVEKLAKTRDITKMTDNEVYRHIADNHVLGAEYLDMAIRGPKSAEYAKAYVESHPELKKVLQHIESQWVGHADLHGGNIMIGKDGKTYLIDFGRISSWKTGK